MALSCVPSCAFLAGGALAWLPHLAQGFLQPLPVGRVAPLQALKLFVLFPVQDAQEVLQLWEAEGFPLLGTKRSTS